MRQLCLRVDIRFLELVVADGKEESDVGVGCGVLTDKALTVTPIV
jgi:hypothetical protein